MATLAGGTGRCHELQTGDVVLFAGRRPILSVLMRFCGPGWSHIGLVLREPEDGEPRLFEADPKRGAVRQVPLAERVAHFRGRVSARRLHQGLNPVQRSRLEALRRELTARDRERRLLDLMAAGEDGWLGASAKNVGMPAAGELVAEAYQRLGLLEGPARGGLPASHFAPRHFAEAAGLQLKRGYALGPELVLNAPDETAAPTGLTPQPA